MISFRGCLAFCIGAIKYDRVETTIKFALFNCVPSCCVLPVQNQPQPSIGRGAFGIGHRRLHDSCGMRVIIAEDRCSCAPRIPLRRDQYSGINLEMTDRVIGYICRCAIAADLAIPAKQDPADFLRYSRNGQALEFGQHGA